MISDRSDVRESFQCSSLFWNTRQLRARQHLSHLEDVNAILLIIIQTKEKQFQAVLARHLGTLVYSTVYT